MKDTWTATRVYTFFFLNEDSFALYVPDRSGSGNRERAQSKLTTNSSDQMRSPEDALPSGTKQSLTRRYAGSLQHQQRILGIGDAKKTEKLLAHKQCKCVKNWVSLVGWYGGIRFKLVAYFVLWTEKNIQLCVSVFVFFCFSFLSYSVLAIFYIV